MLLMVNVHFVLLSMDDSETERDEQRSAPTKKKCLFDDSIVGKVWITESVVFNTSAAFSKSAGCRLNELPPLEV